MSWFPTTAIINFFQYEYRFANGLVNETGYGRNRLCHPDNINIVDGMNPARFISKYMFPICATQIAHRSVRVRLRVFVHFSFMRGSLSYRPFFFASRIIQRQPEIVLRVISFGDTGLCIFFHVTHTRFFWTTATLCRCLWPKKFVRRCQKYVCRQTFLFTFGLLSSAIGGWVKFHRLISLVLLMPPLTTSAGARCRVTTDILHLHFHFAKWRAGAEKANKP